MGAPTFRISSWLFVRALGLIYFVAFVSFGLQIPGLIGSEGIIPIGEILEYVGRTVGSDRYRLLPTLLWIDASDAALQSLWIAGALLSLLVVAGFMQTPALFLLWVMYLSLVTAGREFMGFQWDNLLLEAGFLAIFLLPLELRGRASQLAKPAAAIRLLLYWLSFRLVFSSGVVKFFTSGDPTWANLTALTVHFETQPLPTWVGWYWHQWPAWFHKLSCMFVIVGQLLVPWLIFGPRRIKLIAFVGLVGFQLLIAITGNYGFFNVIALALCVLLLDDATLSRLMPPRFVAAPSRRSRARPALIAAVTGLVLVLSTLQLSRTLRQPLSEGAGRLFELVGPFRSVNGYGLFARMTTSRPEIVVEGSRDGRSWQAYEFPWKPGARARAPAFVAPHMPRLDWQMWFAALGNVRASPWFRRFLYRLLEGSDDVLELLEHNPFPDEPPRYVRALVYDYRFTDFEQKAESGHWWRREQTGVFHPPLSLDHR